MSALAPLRGCAAGWRKRREEANVRRSHPTPTVSDFIPEYLEHIRLRKSPGWVKSQRIYLRKHVAPTWGRLRLDRISSVLVEALVDRWLGKAKATTVNKRLSCLSRFLERARELGHVEHNVARLVPRLPDDTAIHDEVLSREEFDRLVAFARPKLRMFLFLAYHTGVRASEARGLRWSDVDLDKRLLRVTGHKAGRLQRVRLRWIPINAELEGELRSFRRRDEGRHDHLFAHGGRPTWSSLNATFNAAVERAGLARGRWVTPNSLRHTFGSTLASAGLPMRKLQLLMGHSSVMVTERWYAHHSPDFLRGATDALLPSTDPPPADPPAHRE